MKVSNTVFNSNYATDGGSIYIKGTNTPSAVSFTNINVLNSHAIAGGFLNGDYSNKK
jgi:predicted outer membrane repeat protein